MTVWKQRWKQNCRSKRPGTGYQNPPKRNEARTMKTDKSSAALKPYEPTADEKAALQAIREHKKKAPRVKATETKAGIELSLDHPDTVHGHALLMRALGTGEVDFIAELLKLLARAAADGSQVNEQRLNFMLAVIKGIEPKDQLETMLAAQMAAVHVLTMEFAYRLANAENLVLMDSLERTLNKLARTFTAQLEALKRYRTGGEQRVTVQHVSVSDGGQAIVGNVSQRIPGSPEKPQSPS
jgi:hypothetical protein